MKRDLDETNTLHALDVVIMAPTRMVVPKTLLLQKGHNIFEGPIEETVWHYATLEYPNELT